MPLQCQYIALGKEYLNKTKFGKNTSSQLFWLKLNEIQTCSIDFN